MSKKLLCMDDDAMITDIIHTYFEQKGYNVTTAENGERGLELFREVSPDVVLVDLRMPKVDGFQVLETITTFNPDTPILVISGEGEMADVIQALHLGAWHYMTKPLENLDILEHAVVQALEKSALIQQNKAYQKGLEEKLSSIVEHFPGYVQTCTKDFTITYANQKLIEYAGEEIIGKQCFPEILNTHALADWGLNKIGAQHEFVRKEIQNPEDNRWYDVSMLPIFDQDKEIKEYQVILVDITEQKQKLQDAREREELLREENTRLLASFTNRYSFGGIIGKCKPMQEVYTSIINAAGSNASVVIYGESGTGKELVAQSIHETSNRKDGPFICVNCGAIPESLIESEFFGYKKGAFSGAVKDKHGFLDVADSGTLFLDEVGDIPQNLQIKLLRAIEGGGYTPLGGTELIKPDVRIISATNRDLLELAKQGAMRQDFLYRIHVIPIHLPPLRERKEDLRLLIDHFFELYDPGGEKTLPAEIRKTLSSHTWPGNVRELQNTIHRFVTLGKLDFLGLMETPESRGAATEANMEYSGAPLSELMEEFEKKILFQAFEQHNWHQSKTAEALGVDRKTLYRKLKQFKISRPA